MDPSLLITPGFWNDSAPAFMGDFPGKPPEDTRLEGHVMFSTSGSTGSPKWIALSKRALTASAEAVNQHLHVTPSSRWGLALPARHVGGFGVPARVHTAGCGFSGFAERWDPAVFREWLSVEKITHSSLVPTQVHDLVAGGHRAPASLAAIVVGGGCLDAPTGQTARTLGWPVLASYGMTEAASQIATQTMEDLGNLYQPAPIPILPHWKARTEPDGRLSISGPALFSGVLSHQSGLWIYQELESEWFTCSDRVRIANGALTLLGRSDLMVKVLGELVDIGEIERKLSRISAFLRSPGSFAVVAVPDARAEHALVPVFDSALPKDAVIAAFNTYQKQASGFCRLREPVFLTSIPKGPLGKILRQEIGEHISRES